MKKTRGLFLGLAACGLLAASASAQTFDFTSGEGFVDGGVGGQNGIFAQANINVDTSGTGTLSLGATGFLRAVLFNGRPNLDVSNLGVDETLTLTASNVTINRDAADIPSLVFGLTDSTNVGQAQNRLGGQLRLNADGDVLLDAQQFGAVSPEDTGFDIGDTFDWVVEISNNGDGTFDAFSTVGGLTKLTGDDIALGSSLGVILQTQGFTPGTVSVDTVTAVIPEPASAMLIALGGLAGAARRRR